MKLYNSIKFSIRWSISKSVSVACVLSVLWCGMYRYNIILTWPVRVKGARVVVGIDGAWGVSVNLTVDGQVTVSGDGDPLSGGNGVVVDRLGVGVASAQELGEHATAAGPVSLLGSDVFRSWDKG